jgi:hypothetical protein
MSIMTSAWSKIILFSCHLAIIWRQEYTVLMSVHLSVADRLEDGHRVAEKTILTLLVSKF